MGLLDKLPHTATIYRPAYTEDDDGGDSPTLAALSTGVACWVQPAGADMVLEFSKRDQRVTHQIFFNSPTGIAIGDVLIPDAGCYAAGKTLKFLGENNAGAGVIDLTVGAFEDQRPATTQGPI